MTGWITLHRQIKEHWLWNEDRPFTKLEAWLDILLMVNHKDRKVLVDGQLVIVERGQRITSLRKLSERWKWSRTKVNSFLLTLEQDNMLVVKKDSKKTVLTVVNYDFYQTDEYKKSHRKDSEMTLKGHRKDAEMTLKNTNNNDNNEITMNNNDNNENKSVGVTSENINPDYSEIIKEYNKLAFGLPTERTYEQINEWLKLHNKELIIHVMQYAHDLGKHNLSYVNGILRNAKQKQIETVADFEAENNRFTASKSNSYANSLEARIAREQVKRKAERDKQNIKTVIDPNEELPF